MDIRKLLFTPVTIALIGLLTFFLCLPSAYAEQEAGLQVNGKLLTTYPGSFIDNGLVMVPVRELGNALGAEVSWDDEKHAVKVVQDGYEVSMFIGVLQAMVNGKSVQLEGAPLIVEGRAMAPVRIVAEALQIPLAWDSEKRIVSLDKLKLVAGSSLDFPPFEFQEDNKAVGFEIDLIEAVAEVMGEDIIVKDVSFDQLIASLRSGEIDLIISGLTITESRKQVISFSMPYFYWGETIIIPQGASRDMELEDLAGKTIAFLAGSSAQEIVNDLEQSNPDTQLTSYETLEEVWQAVENGQVDAAIVFQPPTAYYLNNNSDSNISMTGKVLNSQPMGIAVQKDRQALLEKLDNSLTTIRENGTYDRIYEKWFGAGVQ